MRRILAAAPLGLACALLVVSSSAAYAVSYLDEAVQALLTGNVYVSTETRTIDTTTKERLIQQTKGTDIGIVILPEGARTEAGDIPQFASQIARESNKETVIVAIGNDLEASGVDASKLANSLEVSKSSTGDALVEFVTEVGSSQHNTPSQTEAGFDPSGLILSGAIVAALVAGGAVWLRRKRRTPSITALLAEVNEYAGKQETFDTMTSKYVIKDAEMRAALASAVKNIRMLFSRIEEEPSGDTKVQEITKHYVTELSKIKRILITYIDIQNHGNYYHADDDNEKRRELLNSGKEKILKLDRDVLTNIRELNKAPLTRFYVDTFDPDQDFKSL